MDNNIFANKNFSGLGVSLINSLPNILYRSKDSLGINLAQSEDGQEFEKTDKKVVILENSKPIDASEVFNLRVSPLFKNHILFFERHLEEIKKTYYAFSQDQVNWQVYGELPDSIDSGLNVENYIYKNQHVFFFGGAKLTLGLTDKGTDWEFMDIPIEGANNFMVDYVVKTKEGILLLYHFYRQVENKNYLEIKATCLDKNNPTKVLWQTKSSLWHEPEIWQEKEATCLGCLVFENRLLSYWNISEMGIYLVTYPMHEESLEHDQKHFKLNKHFENPILEPNSNHIWENEATFNPAAFYDDDKVYLIYRAVGYGYISVLGYAESRDGIHFEKRRSEPIFTGNNAFDSKSPNATFETARGYMSGGSYGGIEDPRITKIDDKLYLVYVAFNGFDPPRLALTSILYEDFINSRFLWEKPVLISPPGIVDKSGCILPEKINGKYVIFHRIFPNILIDFVDDLKFDGSTWLKGEFKIPPRQTMWDSRKVGIGAPPIKTKDGWLLIYQGVTDNDDSKYKIGAMLLDLKDPTKVLYRTNQPIIEPTEHYENGLAKFGVVYPCGAVIKNDKLLVYYGGSDSVVCVAQTNLNEFLDELKKGSKTHLLPIKFND